MTCVEQLLAQKHKVGMWTQERPIHENVLVSNSQPLLIARNAELTHDPAYVE